MKKKVKLQGLICDLPLNEGGGTKAFDKTNLTLTPATVAGNGYKTYTRGSCVEFKGVTTDKVTIGKPAKLNLQTSPMTISVWVWFTSVSNYRYILSDYNAAGNAAQFALILNNTNRFTFFWVTGGTQSPNPTTAEGSTVATAGVWYHVVGVRGGSTGSWKSCIYVNGLFEKETSTAGNPGSQSLSGDATIGQPGSFVSAALAMNGLVNDIKIFDRALTSNEIMRLYIEGRNKF